MSNYSSQLGDLSCHFTWEELKQENVGRTLEVNLEELDEHIQETIEGTEVESYNLKGYYETEKERFDEAKICFEEALSRCKTNDEKVVSLGCLAWLASKMENIAELKEKIAELRGITLDGRNSEDIPEVMAEKAFAIASSGYIVKSFKEARVCINKALKKRPGNVQFKFTKAIIVKKLHQTELNQQRKVKKIRKLFEEVIEESPLYPTLHGLALVEYANFLAKIYQDYGASGNAYAKMAEEIAGANPVILRGVAQFYYRTAGESIFNKYDKLEKAKRILENILRDKPNGCKELTLLGQALTKIYKLTNLPEDFAEAKEYLLRGWKRNRKYITPALDLIRMYKFRYDVTRDIALLDKAENLCNEIWSYETIVDKPFKAKMHSNHASFLAKHGNALASNHKKKSTEHRRQADETQAVPVEDGECLIKIRKAVEMAEQFRENQEDSLLLIAKAEKSFRNVLLDLEKQDQHVQACFHEKYAAFLGSHAMDLAMHHYVESLECSPNSQRDEFVFNPLKKIVKTFIDSGNARKQLRGRKVLEKMQKLRAR